MAVDALSLPPPRFIVPKTGHKLAANASDRWGLSVGVFNPEQEQQQVCQRRISSLDLPLIILVVLHTP